MVTRLFWVQNLQRLILFQGGAHGQKASSASPLTLMKTTCCNQRFVSFSHEPSPTSNTGVSQNASLVPGRKSERELFSLAHCILVSGLLWEMQLMSVYFLWKVRVERVFIPHDLPPIAELLFAVTRQIGDIYWRNRRAHIIKLRALLNTAGMGGFDKATQCLLQGHWPQWPKVFKLATGGHKLPSNHLTHVNWISEGIQSAATE